jgi:hypothetical protein
MKKILTKKGLIPIRGRFYEFDGNTIVEVYGNFKGGWSLVKIQKLPPFVVRTKDIKSLDFT